MMSFEEIIKLWGSVGNGISPFILCGLAWITLDARKEQKETKNKVISLGGKLAVIINHFRSELTEEEFLGLIQQ